MQHCFHLFDIIKTKKVVIVYKSDHFCTFSNSLFCNNDIEKLKPILHSEISCFFSIAKIVFFFIKFVALVVFSRIKRFIRELFYLFLR